MVKYIRQCCLLALTLIFFQASKLHAQDAGNSNQWQNPFETVNTETTSGASPSLRIGGQLSLADALSMVRNANPGLQAARKRVEESVNRIRQAGLRPNPELDVESESVSGGLAGLSESETNVVLSQEFELWGKRGHRKNVASRESDVTRLSESFILYDTYAETLNRFYAVAHAQRQTELAQEAVVIAESFVAAAKLRVDKGAALSSELSLGELELQRAKLDLQQFESELLSAKTQLVALWKGSETSFTAVTGPLPDAQAYEMNKLEPLIPRSRMVEAIQSQRAIIDAELALQRSNARPNVTLSGGYKRLEADNTNTFILGFALPLPVSNRNQGAIAALKSRREALELDREQALLDARAGLQSLLQMLQQARTRSHTIESALLPKAEETYKTLKDAYERGRITFPAFLESQRTLIALRFELNDITLNIRRNLTALERLLGMKVQR